jgi:AbiV family abortive infection protein
MDKENIEKFNKFREACLKNANDLLRASKLALDNKIDHVSFHLSKLALEEIGKLHIASLEAAANQIPKEKEPGMSFDIEDHQRKLFFAIWSPSFGRNKQTKEQLEQNQHLAKTIHERSLYYLYVEPTDVDTLDWEKKIEEGEAQRLYEFVAFRLKYEKEALGEMIAIPEEEKAELKWFFEINEDLQKRKEIWGHKAQDKLIEFGGDTKKWIKWLKEVYEKNEAEMRELLDKELKSKPVSGEEKNNPKWRVKVKIITPSHSIRKKPLTDLNARSKNIKLHYIDNNSLMLELLFPKALPAAGLWDFGWGTSRMFILSMNIATNGLFWWNVKIDTARYYEEIWDLENNAGVVVEMSPRLQIGWKDLRWVYKDLEISVTFLVFNFLQDMWKPGQDSYFEDYATGMSALGKNDVHLRIEISAFNYFFKALKRAMLENKDWDGSSDFAEAYQKRIPHFYPQKTKEMEKYFTMGFEVETNHSYSKPVTVQDVVAIKTYCDKYFLTLARDHHEKVTGEKLEFVMEKKTP